MVHRIALIFIIISATIVAIGCGDNEKKSSTAATPTTASGCKRAAEPKPRAEGNLKRPSLKIDTNKTYRAEVVTNCGSFTIELDAKQSPKTAASFIYLTNKGFYDELTFHRIVPGFVIQGGDPTGSGSGGPGYSITEAPPKGVQYTRGVVAMAKTQLEKPGTSGSQFFVVTGEDAQLPPDYALLGKVISGLNVIDRIAQVPTDSQSERPIDPVVIDHLSIVESSS